MTMLYEFDAVVQDLPDDLAEAVSQRPDRLQVTEPGQQSPEERLRVASVLLRGRLGGLAEDTSQVAAMARAVVLGALVAARADADPGAQPIRDWKGLCLRTDFDRDLLSRIDAQARHRGQSPHGVRAGAYLVCGQPVKSADLLVYQLKTF